MKQLPVIAPVMGKLKQFTFFILEVGIGRSLRGIAVDVGGTSTEAVGKEKGGIFHVLCRQGGTGLRQHDDGQRVCLRDHLLWRYGSGVWR